MSAAALTPAVLAAAGGFAFVVAVTVTGLVRRYALATNLLDVPNDRSSHRVPTPRGGGLGIVAGVVAGLLVVLGARGSLTLADAAWPVGALLVAAAGFIDDRQGLSARTRFFVHAGAAALAIAGCGVPLVPLPGGPAALGWLGVFLAMCALVWSTNLFNFMDGIDGIAAAQAAFVFGAAGSLTAWSSGAPAGLGADVVAACAAMGFLAWNWPPARIFMGDVGSGFVGYVIAAVALSSSGALGVSVWTWVVLHALFLVDATVTLVVRIAHGRTFYQAHRSHVYQRLARRVGAHRPVVLAYAAVNVLWLLPIAVVTVRQPAQAAWLALLALAPLAVLALVCGAGRSDD